MRILELTLKKKWFDMIASGEKKEEYREIKPFWISRLFAWGNAYDYPKDFNAVRFTNGYGKKRPSILVEWEGTETGYGKPEWGAPGNEVFIIKLGKILQS